MPISLMFLNFIGYCKVVVMMRLLLFVGIWITECEMTIMHLLQMKMGCVLVEEGVVAVVLVVQCLVEEGGVFLAFAEQEVYTEKRKK